MHSCVGTSTALRRRSTFFIVWNTGMTRRHPGFVMPVKRPMVKRTPRSYWLTCRRLATMTMKTTQKTGHRNSIADDVRLMRCRDFPTFRGRGQSGISALTNGVFPAKRTGCLSAPSRVRRRHEPFAKESPMDDGTRISAPAGVMNAMAFSDGRDYVRPAALARAFAGEDGRIASVPDVVAARLETPETDPSWERFCTTSTAEYVGLSRTGVPIIVVAHGIGPLAEIDGVI